jgi:hypothetical protein
VTFGKNLVSMTSSEAQRKVAVAAAGIDRFYDDGFTKWPEEKFRVLFTGAALEEEAIQAALHRWEKSGAIKIWRDSTCFVEVLRPIAGVSPS